MRISQRDNQRAISLIQYIFCHVDGILISPPCSLVLIFNGITIYMNSRNIYSKIRADTWSSLKNPRKLQTSQLLVYVRYVHDDDFKDEFLFWKCLETTTRHDLFDPVISFLKEQISWGKVCSVCTDGAPAMLGCWSEFQRFVLSESPKVIGAHCMIHWQILVMKMLSQELQEIMKRTINSVSFIKVSTLNRPLFSKLCKELNVLNKARLFHTEVKMVLETKTF